jgi:hypothetical protein
LTVVRGLIITQLNPESFHDRFFLSLGDKDVLSGEARMLLCDDKTELLLGVRPLRKSKWPVGSFVFKKIMAPSTPSTPSLFS